MTLWFENRWGERRPICDCQNWAEVNRSINDFIAQANVSRKNKFVRYYTRTWEEDGMTKIDVGSHSEFFFWDRLIDNEITDKNGE